MLVLIELITVAAGTGAYRAGHSIEGAIFISTGCIVAAIYFKK